MYLISKIFVVYFAIQGYLAKWRPELIHETHYKEEWNIVLNETKPLKLLKTPGLWMSAKE